MREDMTISYKDLPRWAQDICKSKRMRPNRIKVQVAVEHENIGHNWCDWNVRDLFFYRDGQVSNGLYIPGGDTIINSDRVTKSLAFGAKVILRNTDMVLATNTTPKNCELFVHPDSVPKMLQEVPHVE